MFKQTKTEWRIHFGLVLAELICIPAFVIETKRALDGNTLSWAYVFEWPRLGTYAVYVWRKLLREEHGVVKASSVSEPEHDRQLEEWNAYLDKVHGKRHDDGEA